MKRGDFVQIKGLDAKELTTKVKDLKKDIAGLLLDKNMKKLKDLKSVGKKKKDLAQILTVLKQKELLVQLETKQDSSVKPKSIRRGRTELSRTK